MRRFLVYLILLVTGALLIAGSQVRFVLTERISPTTQLWVDPVYSNYIGGPITVVLRIYVPAGVWVDLSNIPEIGETVDLWRKVPIAPSGRKGYSDGSLSLDPNSGFISNGKFEVHNRVIRREYRGGQQIIEVTYTFLYLDPIDFDHRFTKKLTRSGEISARYLYFDASQDKVVRSFIIADRRDASFYLVRRVEQGDQPISDLGLVNRVVSPLPHFLRLTAVGLVIGMLTAQGWSAVRCRILRRRGLGVVSSPSSTMSELYAGWQNGGDYRYFLEAIQRYRNGFWNKPRPLDWIRTTFIIYSGRVIPAAEIKEIFEYLVALERGLVVAEVPNVP